MSMVKPREMPPFEAPTPRLPTRKGLRRLGKKGSTWQRIRLKLRVLFAEAEITRCEINYPQCFRDEYLYFSHTKRRNDCTEDDLWEVCLACAACATALNGMNKHKEQKILEKIIASRPHWQKKILSKRT